MRGSALLRCWGAANWHPSPGGVRHTCTWRLRLWELTLRHTCRGRHALKVTGGSLLGGRQASLPDAGISVGKGVEEQDNSMVSKSLPRRYSLTEGKMAAFQCGNDATSVRGSKWSPLVIQYIGPPDQAPRRTLVTSVLFLIGIRRVSLRMIQCQTRAEVHARPSLRTCHGLGPVRRCEDRRHGGPCVGSRRDGPCT